MAALDELDAPAALPLTLEGARRRRAAAMAAEREACGRLAAVVLRGFEGGGWDDGAIRGAREEAERAARAVTDAGEDLAFLEGRGAAPCAGGLAGLYEALDALDAGRFADACRLVERTYCCVADRGARRHLRAAAAAFDDGDEERFGACVERAAYVVLGSWLAR